MTESRVEKGKVVTLNYTLHNEQGDLFEYSHLPTSYLHGSGVDLFDEIEHSLEGHKVGDHVEVTLSPADGFGHYDASLTFTDDLENVPEELHHIGAELEALNAKGETMKFYVTRIDKERGKLTVDANHPLAGQTVKFNVTITKIRDANPEELASGRPVVHHDVFLQ